MTDRRTKVERILDSIEEMVDVRINELTEDVQRREETGKRIDALYAHIMALVGMMENPDNDVR